MSRSICMIQLDGDIHVNAASHVFNLFKWIKTTSNMGSLIVSVPVQQYIMIYVDIMLFCIDVSGY